MKHKLAAVMLAAGTAGCQPASQPASKPLAGDTALVGNDQRGETTPEPRNQRASALQTALGVFVSESGSRWEAYDGVPGVDWRDAEPVASENTESPSDAYRREGTISLEGFGPVHVPNGEVGAEADSLFDNEGRSGLTMFGSTRGVETIAVMKFYASHDYEKIIRRQLARSSIVALVADHCGDNDPGERKFLEVVLSGGASVYVEAYVDAAGGLHSPGSTTFEFRRTKPTKAIDDHDCQVAVLQQAS